MKKQYSSIFIVLIISINTFSQIHTTAFEKSPILNLTEHSSYYTLTPDEQPSLVSEPELATQKLDSIIEFRYNETTGSWDKKHKKETFNFNKSLKEVNYSYFSWDETKLTWHKLYEEESAYDERNNLQNITSYTLGLAGKTPFSKEEIIYNTENKQIESSYSIWSNSSSDWALSEKKLSSYNTEGKVLKDSILIRNNSNNDWDIYEKADYEYWPDNVYIHYIFKSKWSTENDWTLHDYKWYNYINTQKYFIVDHKRDHINNKWVRNKFIYHNWDESLNMIASSTITIDTATHKPISGSYQDFEYDYQEPYKQLILPRLLKTEKRFFHHKVSKKELAIRDIENNKKVKQSEFIYYYSPVQSHTGMKKTIKQQLKLHPNPCSEIFKLANILQYSEIRNVYIYSSSGEKVMHKSQINTNQTFDISGLANGLYFVVVETKSGKLTSKLIKK